ncbi:MAG: inositol monophosphatase [Thermoleophilaceae bacterium]|nr:inositol monophosphatase [Thermoleophilaceae bacterium]
MRHPRAKRPDLSTDVELAERAARAAADVLLSAYGRPPEGLGSKSSDTDLVSDADRAAERAIRDLLALERPDDGLLAEEGSHSEGGTGRRWIVDPLDGTINFLYGFPAWAVSVALEDADGLAVGVVLDPIRDECFMAERGDSARVRAAGGEVAPLHVTDRRTLDRALVATGFSYEPIRRSAQADVVRTILPRVRDIRRAGAAALDLAWLAAGRVDAYYERGVNHWDWAAGRLLVEEAGGSITDLPGKPPGLLAAATPALHAALGALDP